MSYLDQAVWINKLKGSVDSEVTIRGWIRNRRMGKNMWFIDLRDGSDEVQCALYVPDANPDLVNQLKEADLESIVQFTGKVVENAKAIGGIELQISSGEILQSVTNFPINKPDHNIQHLMKYRHLWIRSRKQVAILKIRDEIIRALREFMAIHAFINVDTPIFTPNACEGTTTLFEVDFHGDKAYLSQSGQLYNEANAAALGRVYCFGPTFRAEKSATRRHLLEFWMLEMEAAFYDFEDNLDFQEHLLAYVADRILSNYKPELELLERNVTELESATKLPYFRLHYKDAIKMVSDSNNPDISMVHGDDFGAPHEVYISQQYDRPVFIHHYPTKIKPFYMKIDPIDPEYVLNADLLVPGLGELIGGSQREDNLEHLLNRIRHENLPENLFEWYIDLRRYGTFVHSGFGIGLERLVLWVCGLDHIRTAIAYPRMLHQMYP